MEDARTFRPAARGAAEIAAELRREFEATFQARYGHQPTRDPVLGTLFHSLAVQIGRLYDEAERVFPDAVLDGLISGLGMPPRLASPAQAVVCFTGVDRRERIGPLTQLSGYSRTGEQIGFTPDDSIELAPTSLAFAAVYEAGRLHVVAGAHLPDGPALASVSTPLNLGTAAPTIFLAFEADAAHLGGLGVFIDMLPLGGSVTQAVRRSPWQLLSAEGRVWEPGVLRARPGRGGVQDLQWADDTGLEADSNDVTRALDLSDGPYGGQVWVFPPIPAARRVRSSVPAALVAAAPRLLPEGFGAALERPLAWVQIPLPVGANGVVSAIQGINLNCVTASNVEPWSEQVVFDRLGTVVDLRPEGVLGRHIMGVLSVVGETGTHYVEDADVGAPISLGRYRYRETRFEFRPARQPTGRFDAYAMLRLLLCDAERGNGLDVGDIRQIGSSLANVTAQVANLTVSRGGSAPPSGHNARLRFAELLRTRERIVTAADLEIAARAFEPRIWQVDVTPTSEVTHGGLRPVETVRVAVRKSDFADPPAELVRLRARLERHLQARSMIGHQVRVLLQPDG